MTIIGIDLGTTNSLAAYWKDGKSHLIPNPLGEVMTPSVVGLDDQGQVITGQMAKERLQTHPQLTVASFKRYMGTDRTIKLGKKKYRPEELSALILASLKQDAEALLGETITHAVISVPAYFNDAQRKATKIAGQLAGFQVDRLINEPTAAAIAYGLHQAEENSTFLVFDVGGGTFDVSILELFSGVMQVHSAAGDNYLGGEDFAEVLVQLIAEKTQLDVSSLTSQQQAHLHKHAETCKRALSDNAATDISFALGKEVLQCRITRDEFQDASGELLARLRSPVERALRDAGLKASELDAMVLVGGATRMPLIRSLSAKMLGQMPMMNINPDEVVARGAAVLTGIIQNDASLEEIVLTDVSPYTLGTDIVNHNDLGGEGALFHPIIERNSPVPVSRSEHLYTAHDFQTTLHVGIYQGESRLVRDNIKLGELKLAVPSKPAGHESIDVRFTYDINGLLEVEVEVNSTGQKKRVVIEGNPGVMTPKEIEAALSALKDLKIHPRDQVENSTLLARGERLYEESLGDKRAYISTLMSQFEAVLQRQNQEEITRAREEIQSIFNDLEASPLH